MESDLGDIFSSFGCFDDNEVAPSLFDNLETLNLPSMPGPESLSSSYSEEDNLRFDPNSPSFVEEMMSLGSPTPTTLAESEDNPSLISIRDHSYFAHENDDDVIEYDANKYLKKSSLMLLTGSASPQHGSDGRSPSPGGSLTSQEESGDLLQYLMNETGVKVSEKVERMPKHPVSVRSVHKGKGKKRCLSNEEDDNEADMTDKSRKNAIAARENRLKKKRYMEGLEKENKALSSENTRLHKTQDKLNKRVSSLAEEVDYLRSVLFNQSALSGLLQKVGSDTKVRLSSSFNSRQQRFQPELLKPSRGGVCLHVNGKDASLEFCARCSQMSSEDGQQQEEDN